MIRVTTNNLNVIETPRIELLPKKKKKGKHNKIAGRKTFLRSIKALGAEEEYSKCCVCGWDKAAIDWAHLEMSKDGGDWNFDNIVPLCPNQHRELDMEPRGLNAEEMLKIGKFLYKIKARLAVLPAVYV